MAEEQASVNSEETLIEEKPSTRKLEDWVKVRVTWTKQAIQDGDLMALRKISALPGGFGGEEVRKKAWSALLRTRRLSEIPPKDGQRRQDTEHNSEETQSLVEDIKPSSPDPGPLEHIPHPNERQVKLDTDRSFVTYPKGLPSQSKPGLQADLNDLIVGVLRKYPALSYFQGYHDILSVLYLTFVPPISPLQRSRSSSRARIRTSRSALHTPEPFPTPVIEPKTVTISDEEDRSVKEESPPPAYAAVSRDTEDWRELRRCAEMVSLNRVRDAMGSGMEGMMGLLRILKRVLRAADPELSKFSAKISPVPTLPFFALSWVLTLFSHDCNSLIPVQRMFDFLLARNPISAVYLAAGVLISKKPQMFEIARQLGEEYEEDPTLLHPLFVRLPPLYADTPSEPESASSTVSASNQKEMREFTDDDPNPYKAIKLSELFTLTDTLMEQYPWDGDVISGRDIMGEGSVVCSYASEDSAGWTPDTALQMVDVEVVKPGAGLAVDDDEEAEDQDPMRPNTPTPLPIRRKLGGLRFPRNKLSTVVAVGIVVLGVGMAVYGVRAGGNEASWGRWWSHVIRGWIGREGRRLEGGIGRISDYVNKALREAL
ncbi:hypothetical protein I317_01165 [Kwoniella heveanensis CBS 569]|nr:hypothetical protein I317_01165 [Kwoniella heveanensis CBS 569]